MNLHPPFSAFPFALLLLASIAELVALVRPSPVTRRIAVWNLIAGSVGVALAFFSGYQAAETFQQRFVVDESLVQFHHLTGKVALISVVITLALRWAAEGALFYRRTFFGLYLAALTVTLGVVVYTGYLGGELVFTHGAGVTGGELAAGK